MDYRSLENKIRDLWIAEANRNTEIRRKVANVGRPEDNVKDETSKLGKQGEIKTKIIDEAIDDDPGKLVSDKKKPKDSDMDDMEAKTIKGGKTEVDTEPKTDDSTEDSSDEDKKSKKATNQENKKIGAKGVKEETMNSKLTFGSPQSLIDSIAEAMKSMKGICPKCKKAKCICEGWKEETELEEKLVGGQKKLDKNHNGKLDKQDFKMLRKEEVEELDEISLKTKINAYKAAADHDAGYNYGDKVHAQADRLHNRIVAKHGRAAGYHATVAAYGKAPHGDRRDEPQKSDPLTKATSSTNKMRITKSGVAHKQDQKANASIIKSRLGKHGKSNLPEEFEELDEVSHRDYAAKGKMHPDMAKGMHVGREGDFYAHGTGDKKYGKVVKNTGKEVHVKQTHDSYSDKKVNKLHKFKVSHNIDEETDPGFSAEELARIEEIANNLDEVVTARKLTAADKVARAKYLAAHKAKMASYAPHEVKADAKSFKDRNTEVGDYSKEPSTMHKTGLINTFSKQDAKVSK